MTDETRRGFEKTPASGPDVPESKEPTIDPSIDPPKHPRMNHLQQLIAQGRLEEALNELVKSVPPHLQTAALNLQGRLHNLTMRQIGGVLSNSEISRERNQISLAALELCNKVDAPTHSSPPPPVGTPASILFLAANPTDQARLQTEREYKTIRDRIRQSSQREQLELLMPEISLTIEDLLVAMNQKPRVVHFSGHGSSQGIFITNDHNQAQLMPAGSLKRLFRQHQDSVRLVLLNACYSAEQAALISGLGMYVIGMNAPVGDGAAISFAAGLYIGLGAGKPVEQAFDDAMIVMEVKHPHFASLPEVWKDGKKLNL